MFLPAKPPLTQLLLVQKITPAGAATDIAGSGAGGKTYAK